MGLRTGFFTNPLLLIMAAVPVSACGQAPSAAGAEAASSVKATAPPEVYLADVREAPPELGLSSSISLYPNGRIEWRLETRELALQAEGEWSRDGGMIRLSNPQQVSEPSLELVSSARNSAVGLTVELEPQTARMASTLEAEIEYPGERHVRIPLSGGAVSIPAAESRPVAVRLMSPAFSIRTQPIPVLPEGDNVLTLRLVPANLGQAFFGSQQTAFDPNGMTIDWRGIGLRYDRSPGTAERH